jgi:predicted 3-demethylubiquinone-9 3-methyltransferase (glyoxalase superfamily)
MQKVTPFLMFTGRAAEAIEYYVATFERSSVQKLDRWPAGGHGVEGTVYQSLFTIAGQEVMAFDSPPVHGFGFTPSTSMFVIFDKVDELDRAYERLSQDGAVMMPLDKYPFSDRYAWVSDKFGVSWQLSLKA